MESKLIFIGKIQKIYQKLTVFTLLNNQQIGFQALFYILIRIPIFSYKVICYFRLIGITCRKIHFTGKSECRDFRIVGFTCVSAFSINSVDVPFMVFAGKL